MNAYSYRCEVHFFFALFALPTDRSFAAVPCCMLLVRAERSNLCLPAGSLGSIHLIY
jgi:hypothetical protein